MKNIKYKFMHQPDLQMNSTQIYILDWLSACPLTSSVGCTEYRHPHEEQRYAYAKTQTSVKLREANWKIKLTNFQ